MRYSPLGRAGVLTALSALLFCLPLLPAVFSDEGSSKSMPLDSAADFVRIANNAYPGIATPVRETTSPNAGTGAPSGQSYDPLPVEELLTWPEYYAQYEALMDEDLEQVGYAEWRQKVDELNERWQRSEERRSQGFRRSGLTSYKPIDTRAAQIERGVIRLNDQEVEP